MRNHRPIETRRSPVGRPESVASGDSVLVGASPSAKRAKAGFWVLASIFGLFLVASTTPLTLAPGGRRRADVHGGAPTGARRRTRGLSCAR